MTERIRTIHITIVIDTTKETYEGEFSNIKDAIEFYNRYAGEQFELVDSL